MKKLLLFLLVIIISVTAGCKSIPVETVPPENTQQHPEENLDKPEEPPEKDEIKELLAGLSLAEKIGQMVIVGFDGTVPDAELKRMISDNHIGGLIFFGRNIKDGQQLLALVNDITEHNSSNSIPLFLAVDEEGGSVTRLPRDNIRFPPASEIGGQDDPVLAFANGQAIGTKLTSYGFNLNFAPVLDILSNPENKVIGDRSFGAYPGLVARMGVATMSGLQSTGVVPVIKHFPGHGDTRADSHYQLPVVVLGREQLERFELVPFKEAISAGADAVMAAHIKYPELDESGLPATLSPAILGGLLRDDLGFNGVIITDDLEMGAITKHYSIKEAALQAVLAGADIILICHSAARQQDALDALHEAIDSGKLSVTRLDESVERIIRLKKKYNLF